MKLTTLVFSFFIIGHVSCQGDIIDYEDQIYKDVIQFFDDCGSRELSLCLKENALKYIENLPSSLDIGDGIKIKPNFERVSRQYTPTILPKDLTARENVLDNVLLERILDYFTSHTVEFRVPTDTIKDLQRSMEEGRKKKKKNAMPLLMLFQLKAATLGAIALKFIGLIAFKALLVAKIALTIASVIALKKLVESKHHTSTYEVLAHPHFDEHSFDRSFNQDLPYRGHLESNSNLHY